MPRSKEPKRKGLSKEVLAQLLELESALKSPSTRKALESVIEHTATGRLDETSLASSIRRLVGGKAAFVVAGSLSRNDLTFLDALKAEGRTPFALEFFEAVLPKWGSILDDFLDRSGMPDDWSGLVTHMKYDFDLNVFSVRAKIIKENKEEFDLESTSRGWIRFAARIIEEISAGTQRVKEAKLELGSQPDPEQLERLEKAVVKLKEFQETSSKKPAL